MGLGRPRAGRTGGELATMMPFRNIWQFRSVVDILRCEEGEARRGDVTNLLPDTCPCACEIRLTVGTGAQFAEEVVLCTRQQDI